MIVPSGFDCWDLGGISRIFPRGSSLNSTYEYIVCCACAGARSKIDQSWLESTGTTVHVPVHVDLHYY